MDHMTGAAAVDEGGTVQVQSQGAWSDIDFEEPGAHTFPAPLVALTALLIAAALVAGSYTGLCAFVASSQTIWPGVTILGQDLSGLTVDEAAAKLDAAIPGLAARIYLYDGAASPRGHASDPDASILLSRLGVELDGRQIAQAAHDINVMDPPFFSLGWQYLTGEGVSEYRAALHLDPEKEAARAQETAEALSYPITETSYTFENDILTVTNPVDGRSVDPADIQRKLGQITDDLSPLALDVPYTVLDAGVASAEAVHEAVYRPTRNATYDKSTGGVAPGDHGVDFDTAALQAQLDVTPQGGTVTTGVTVTAPKITSTDLAAVLFRDVLGEASTPLTGGSVRINNVKLAASAINGTVLNAGEVFSYNGTTGQRTRAKGYGEAPAYVNGMTVNEVGGGVCQPSSTLYYACLRSNMEITERYAHRYIPSYIDPGMDATVSWGGPDYKFTNNTDYPVKISAYTSNGRLYVKLIGTNVTGRYAKMTYELISTTGYKTVYKKDPSLASGTVYSTPYTGYKYRTYRNVYSADGTLLSSEYEATSDYKARDRIIIRN